MGMNQKYPVCAENLFGRLLSVKSLLGSVDDPIVSKIASHVYDEFKIPVCRLILQILNNESYLCSLIPLHPEELNAEDLRILSERIEAVGKHFG